MHLVGWHSWQTIVLLGSGQADALSGLGQAHPHRFGFADFSLPAPAHLRRLMKPHHLRGSFSQWQLTALCALHMQPLRMTAVCLPCRMYTPACTSLGMSFLPEARCPGVYVTHCMDCHGAL